MRRDLISASCVLVILAALWFTGCKDGAPQSELDQFIDRTTALEGQVLQDTLRHLAAGEPPFSVYANYMIGNGFYLEAGDSAMVSGWNTQAVNTRLDSAVVYFNKAVALDSTFIEALVNLGSLWDDRSEQMGSRAQREERAATARQYYELALKVDPTDEKARCNLGSLYLRQRKTTNALAEFQKVLEYDPESALAHYNLAIMFAEAKVYREAIAEWELAVKYDKDGDIGNRSRENIKIVTDLMNTPPPETVQ